MHVHINDLANISDGYILLGDWRVRDDICFDGISRLDVRRMRLSREDSRIGVLVLGDSFLSAVAGRAQRGQRISMDAPIQPRAQDFGLIDEDLPRLERHWYPPVTAHGGPSPGATISVRWLKPGRLAILGVVLAALWIFLSTHSITLTALGTLLFGGGLGAIAGMIVAGLIVRPLYLLAATAWVPGFGAFRLFKHAQDAYQAALTKYQLWQQRTAVEFWCSLPGVGFEREVALLYQGLGYHVRLTPGTADGGVDIVLERDRVVTAVQCKAHRKKIGIAVGRELVASAKDIGADRMMIACTHGVSAPLGAYAREKGIQIVTAGELARLQMGLKEMGSKKLFVERPASIAERLKRRRAAPPRT